VRLESNRGILDPHTTESYATHSSQPSRLNGLDDVQTFFGLLVNFPAGFLRFWATTVTSRRPLRGGRATSVFDLLGTTGARMVVDITVVGSEAGLPATAALVAVRSNKNAGKHICIRTMSFRGTLHACLAHPCSLGTSK
jgi:hypothetical protein